MKQEDESVTGRDGYIMAQALYQACKYQEMLKDSGSTLYEWSNHQDMKELLNSKFGGIVGVFLAQDRYMGRDVPNLTNEKREVVDLKEEAE